MRRPAAVRRCFEFRIPACKSDTDQRSDDPVSIHPPEGIVPRFRDVQVPLVIMPDIVRRVQRRFRGRTVVAPITPVVRTRYVVYPAVKTHPAYSAVVMVGDIQDAALIQTDTIRFVQKRF